MTILDQLAATTDPAWEKMIDERRRTDDANVLEANGPQRETHWGRRGGTFHKGNEFFKK
jgi:hypothetical protein